MSLEEATKGKRVNIAGREVQLPPDAWLGGPVFLSHAYAHELKNGKLVPINTRTGEPYTGPIDSMTTIVHRGNARATVGHTTRRLAVASPEQEHLFDFLKEALGP